MTVEIVKDVLLKSLLINYGVLLTWFAAFLALHDWMFRLHLRWFRLTLERFDAIHYCGMAAYKIAVVLLNVAPYLALASIDRVAS